MLILGIILALVLVLAVAAAGAARIAKRPGRPLMWQFGEFTNYRAGVSGHPVWHDEPPIVPYRDFKYWIRLRPNPGFNLPALGYWSQAHGYSRRR